MPDTAPMPERTPASSSEKRTGRTWRRFVGPGIVTALALGGLGTMWYLDQLHTVRESYRTLAEAERHLEPEHIPPILPPSSHDLSVQWDEEDVSGTFRFNPKEIDLFTEAGAMEVEPHGAAREISPGLDEPEELFLKYRDNDTVWTIVVSEDGDGGFRSDF